MADYPAPASFQFNTFKGIRTRNGIAANGTISATVCQNVDFAASSYDAGVLIRTSYGNCMTSFYSPLYAYVYIDSEHVKHIIYITDTTIAADTTLYDETRTQNTDPNWAIAEVDNNYVIQYDGHNATYSYRDSTSLWTCIKGFETVQEGVAHLLLYMESETTGRLVEYSGGTFTTLKTGLSVTGQANGITLKNGAYDVFAFTNGVDYYSVRIYPSLSVTKLTPKYNNVAVTGLALCEQDGSLVIGCENGVVLASRKGDITDWDYSTPTDNNKAWYQIFGKKVTAVVPYIDALLVFTEDDSTVLQGNMSKASTAKREDASLGGCMSFESWCKHDKYLFFYDNKQKNIYYYMQNNYGQKVLGEPIAPEVQNFFNDVTKLQMVSYIGNNRSEIWILGDNFKLIYDYFIGEWSERVCQDLTSYFTYDNEVYSTGAAKCFKEKVGNICMFDGEFYPAVYKTQIINLGSFSDMKEMEIQPLFSVTADFNNTFYVDCLINGKKTKTKFLQSFLNGAVWADDEEQTEETPENELWAEDEPLDPTEEQIGQIFPDENSGIIRQLKSKFISNWYFLQFTMRTEEPDQDFAIACLELKGITSESDTTGQK